MKQKLNVHTPGPWMVLPWFAPGGAEITTVQALNRTVADCPGEDATSKANARLISAAPDLLAALEAVLPWLGKAVFYDIASLPVETSKEDLSSVLSMAGKAIAKARGET